jgi:cyclopropane fatty-acyl-phospholipid synthase-like methyltransferase
MMAYSAACERNKDPILARLLPLLSASRQVLEIGSGTGQHAVYFAARLEWLAWQPTDRDEWLPGLTARIDAEGPANLLPPLRLDVRDPDWPLAGVDAVFTANTLHIMSWKCVQSLFERLDEGLADGALLVAYGPFAYGGRHTSASNAAFDAQLRAQDPLMGVRDFDAVDALARSAGLALLEDFTMPANNRLLAWRRVSRPGRPPQPAPDTSA